MLFGKVLPLFLSLRNAPRVLAIMVAIDIYGQDAPKPNIMLKFQVNNYDLKSIIINHLPLNISFNNAYAFHSF